MDELLVIGQSESTVNTEHRPRGVHTAEVEIPVTICRNFGGNKRHVMSRASLPSREPFTQPLFSKLETMALLSRSVSHLTRGLPPLLLLKDDPDTPAIFFKYAHAHTSKRIAHALKLLRCKCDGGI